MRTMHGTVRIFISSTFRDMHAERDKLVGEVFPELRRRCEPLGLDVVDVDLRWGVTEDEAENGGALDICLEEINRSKPFFIALLGERYGWVPGGSELSITAQEIFHGVLLPISENGSEISKDEWQHRKERSFFYFRDSSFSRDVQEAARHHVLAENVEAAAKQEVLKDRIRHFYADLPDHVVDGYACTYAGLRINYHLLNDEERERLHDVAGDDSLIDNDEFYSLDDADRQTVLSDALPYLDPESLDEWATRVTEDLWAAIREEYPQEEVPSSAEIEARLHEGFANGRRSRFIGREVLLGEIAGSLEYGAPVLVAGVHGAGKSALLAKNVDRWQEAHPDGLVIERYVGASPTSLTLEANRLSAWELLAERSGREMPGGEDRYGVAGTQAFKMMLTEVAEEQPVLIVFDGLNQLDDWRGDLAWLSFRGEDEEWPDSLYVLLGEVVKQDEAERRHPGWTVIEAGPLSQEEQRTLVTRYLGDFRKHLPDDLVEILITKEHAERPLYLQVACEELRLFSRHEEVARYVEHLPGTLRELFALVLDRIERSADPGVVRGALSAIGASRGGIAESELLAFLGDETSSLPQRKWAPVHLHLRRYMKRTGDGEGLIDFFHQQLAWAVRGRYMPKMTDIRKVHADICAHYIRAIQAGRQRVASQVLFHAVHAQNTELLEKLVTDLSLWVLALDNGGPDLFIDDALAAFHWLEINAASFPGGLRVFLRVNAHLLRLSSKETMPSSLILLQRAVENDPTGRIAKSAFQIVGNTDLLWLVRTDDFESAAHASLIEVLETDSIEAIEGVVPLRNGDHFTGKVIAWSGGRVFLWDERGRLEKIITPHWDGPYDSGCDSLKGVCPQSDGGFLTWGRGGISVYEMLEDDDRDLQDIAREIIASGLADDDESNRIRPVRRWDEEGRCTQHWDWSDADVPPQARKADDEETTCQKSDSSNDRLVVLPAGSRVILAWGQDFNIHCFDELGNQQVLLFGHGSVVSGVATTDRKLYSWAGSGDGSVRVWDLVKIERCIYQGKQTSVGPLEGPPLEEMPLSFLDQARMSEGLQWEPCVLTDSNPDIVYVWDTEPNRVGIETDQMVFWYFGPYRVFYFWGAESRTEFSLSGTGGINGQTSIKLRLFHGSDPL